ncbi:MAG: Gfo/Idh/MocA family oxidoreductase [Kiritimatiellaeota bacterium]|nr:Gfo/Idh/MocA family oxidoreductase [Kiritimatiellota bacterium]
MPNIAVISVAHVHSDGFCKHISEATSQKRPYVIWDDDAVRGAQYAEKYNTRFEPDLAKVAADPKVDGFLVCAENTRHLPLLRKVLPVGKPVMCEKPLATSIADIEEILALAKQHKTPLISGYMQPFFPHNRAAKKAIADGALGKVTHLNFRNAHHAAYGRWFDNPQVAWFTDPALAGGGALLDMGTHALHLLCHLGGPVEAVWGHVANVAGIYPKVDDYGLLLIKFKSGVLGRVEAGWVFTGGMGGLEVIGSEQSIWDAGQGLIMGGPGKPAAPLPAGDARPDRINRLIALIKGEIAQAELDEDLAACADAVRAMAAAYESAKTGGWVKL